MEIKEINKFIEEEMKRLEEYYSDKDKNEITAMAGFKVIEELGELFEEILKMKGHQRRDKLKNIDKEDIEKEFADVIFTLLILAKRFNIDVEKAIKIKMSEIKKRKYIK